MRSVFSLPTNPISAVPTYYLIGPDGNLVTSSTQWSDVYKKLVASPAGSQQRWLAEPDKQ